MQIVKITHNASSTVATFVPLGVVNEWSRIDNYFKFQTYIFNAAQVGYILVLLQYHCNYCINMLTKICSTSVFSRKKNIKKIHVKKLHIPLIFEEHTPK